MFVCVCVCFCKLFTTLLCHFLTCPLEPVRFSKLTQIRQLWVDMYPLKLFETFQLVWKPITLQYVTNTSIMWKLEDLSDHTLVMDSSEVKYIFHIQQ